MKYALINGILLDGTETMHPRSGLTVLVNGDRIEAIVPPARKDRIMKGSTWPAAM